jgi:signal transduction histidine kinase
MRHIATAGGHNTAIVDDNLIMTGPAASPLRRVLKAPFTRRAWAEVGYALATLPLALTAVAFMVVTFVNTFPFAASTPGVRTLGAAARFLARGFLGEDGPAPPLMRPVPRVRVTTADAGGLAKVAESAGGRVRQWAFQYGTGITVSNLPPAQIAELAGQADIAIDDMRPGSRVATWVNTMCRDKPAMRARGYFLLKLPLAAAGVVVAAGGWLGGLFYLTFPAWWSLAPHVGGFPIVNLATSFTLLPLGAALLLAGPWLLHGVTEADLRLIRGLLGPSSPTERIRTLEESRARAVDDSAARLRNIERDLHDGTQAQLVALAMKLGLAKEKLEDTAAVDLARVTQLVDDAHRSAVEAIADLRTLARGIHPAVLDNGLADALATLAARSPVPVEVITDTPERPSAAIETIAYFSAAELLTNVAKHSGARHATLEAVHVPGLLRVRVSDDGKGGAYPAPHGGLRGLAERVRTVDGRLEISSPRGGPTVVTVELPSHA